VGRRSGPLGASGQPTRAPFGHAIGRAPSIRSVEVDAKSRGSADGALPARAQHRRRRDDHQEAPDLRTQREPHARSLVHAHQRRRHRQHPALNPATADGFPHWADGAGALRRQPQRHSESRGGSSPSSTPPMRSRPRAASSAANAVPRPAAWLNPSQFPPPEASSRRWQQRRAMPLLLQREVQRPWSSGSPESRDPRRAPAASFAMTGGRNPF
jgi:hypothetical protein